MTPKKLPLTEAEIDEVVEWLRDLDMEPLHWGGFLEVCSQAKRYPAMVEALREAGLCFDAAYFEGLQERLTEMPYETGNLRDLVERRILYADTYIKAALKGETPQ